MVDAVTGEEGHHLAWADVRSLQGVAGHHNRVQAEVVDLGVASSGVAAADPVLGVGVVLLQGGVETLDQGPEGKLGDGWPDLGDPLGLAHPALNRSFRRL